MSNIYDNTQKQIGSNNMQIRLRFINGKTIVSYEPLNLPGHYMRNKVPISIRPLSRSEIVNPFIYIYYIKHL